jgi:hypothetical protein
MRSRSLNTALVILGLATAMHVDWHAARPVVHHLSLGWRLHWLLAVPVCALTAWFVVRAWPEDVPRASLTIFGIATILAAGVEPAWEYWVEGASFEWAFGRVRLAAFAAFLAAGVLTHAALVILAKLRLGTDKRHRHDTAAPLR